jgi:hypothetical protein
MSGRFSDGSNATASVDRLSLDDLEAAIRDLARQLDADRSRLRSLMRERRHTRAARHSLERAPERSAPTDAAPAGPG